MSSLIVDVSEIKEIIPHENADRLEIAIIKGWQVIIQKGLYKPGQKVVYCPIDAILPQELSDTMDITKYLSKGRVRTAKLRGVYSQGLIIPMKFLPEGDYKIGDDVKDLLHIRKYEPPPPPPQMAGKLRKSDPNFFMYTDIENIKNFPDILQEDECVVVTEKVHGTNFRMANVDGDIHVGSHRCDLVEDYENIYWKSSIIYNLKEILKPGMEIFGEVYGGNIQKHMNYGKKEPDVLFFDLMWNKKYLSFNEFFEFCDSNDLPIAPVLYIGKWSNDILDLANGKSGFTDNHIKEGIVIKPLNERWDKEVGRVILKHISEAYLMKNYDEGMFPH